MEQLATDLWILKFPLKVLGTHHGRTVTVIRLKSGKLIVHSMAPFSPQQRTEILDAGEPGWLVEAMLLHDTYSQEGRECFPGLPFYAPEGFSEVVQFPTLPLANPPEEWAEEIRVLEIQGAPRLRETVMLHRPSRTLILADLVFNFSPGEKGWDRFFHRHVAGFRRYPGMSRVFRLLIQDRVAFRASVKEILSWDFDRIIPGHGDVIPSGGRELLRQAMQEAKVYSLPGGRVGEG